MKLYRESTLAEFHFWDAALETVKFLSNEELDIIDRYMTKTIHRFFRAAEVNDFFSFEKDRIASVLGFEDWNSLVESRSNT